MMYLRRKLRGLATTITLTFIAVIVIEGAWSIGRLVSADTMDQTVEIVIPTEEPSIVTSSDVTGTGTQTTMEVNTEIVPCVETPATTSEPANTEPMTLTTSSMGEEKYVPENMGSIRTYMAWQLISDPTTAQYRLRVEAENYDDNDFGMVGDRYAVAVKPYYGKIGDYIDIIQSDGSVIKAIIADYKGNENVMEDGPMSRYVHSHGDIVEFLVNQNAWYGCSPERTVYDYHPDWKQDIKSIYNVGNYWGE